MNTRSLKNGTIVRALMDLDPDGARVERGDLGVVFAEADHYDDDAGPMVRWFRLDEYDLRVTRGGACNVYDGDVTIEQEVET